MTDIKTEGSVYLRDKFTRYPAYRVIGVRRKGGVISIWARLWNCGNSISDAKGRNQVTKSKVASTNALMEDGPACSSDEAAVMAVERRGRVVPVDAHVNFLGRMSM